MLKMTKIKCFLPLMCKLVVLMIKIKLVQVVHKCKINKLVHHLMINQVQAIKCKYSNIARDHPLDHIIGDCRCFPHGWSHQRVNLYACSLSQMVMQEDTKVYPGSGKRRPYVQRRREVCIVLHLSACTGVNTSAV